MRKGRPLARGDNRVEGETVGPGLPEGGLDKGGRLLLGHARPYHTGGNFKTYVKQPRRLPYPLQLKCILAYPCLASHARQWFQLYGRKLFLEPEKSVVRNKVALKSE